MSAMRELRVQSLEVKGAAAEAYRCGLARSMQGRPETDGCSAWYQKPKPQPRPHGGGAGGAAEEGIAADGAEGRADEGADEGARQEEGQGPLGSLIDRFPTNFPGTMSYYAFLTRRFDTAQYLCGPPLALAMAQAQAQAARGLPSPQHRRSAL
jgi:hypothetical protein